MDTGAGESEQVVNGGVVVKREDEAGVDYWKQQCALLRQQNALLRTANEMLSEQIEKLTGKNEENEKKELENEGQSAFLVFPEEVWEIILGHLKDTQDLLNVCKTTKQLDGVLHPIKGSWMFELVVGHVFKWLTRKDVLNCRLVCKQWNSAIDRFLEKHPSKQPFCKDSISTPVCENELRKMRLSTSAVFNLWEDDKMSKRLAEMSQHPRNPFIGRTVVFSVEIDNDFEDEEDEYDDPGVVDYWDTARSFLGSLGAHIWYVEIKEDSGHQKPLELYKLLRDLLIKLPNLRSLTFEADICRDDYQPKAFPSYAVGHPLPAMPHLKSLDLHLYPEVPQSIHDNLIAMYSMQLSKLILCMKRWKSSYSRGFVKLKELLLRNVSREGLTSVEAPNLEKLSLELADECSTSSSLPLFTASSLFQTLSRFQFLRVLQLFVDLSVEIEEMKPETRKQYSFPNMEKVVIGGVCQTKISYSFLLCFPSLKYISISESRNILRSHENPVVLEYLDGNAHAYEEAVQVQKYLRIGRMYESNIWKLVPALKRFSYEKIRGGEVQIKYSCTRDMYNEYPQPQ